MTSTRARNVHDTIHVLHRDPCVLAGGTERRTTQEPAAVRCVSVSSPMPRPSGGYEDAREVQADIEDAVYPAARWKEALHYRSPVKVSPWAPNSKFVKASMRTRRCERDVTYVLKN
ncbi:hypothetical protein LshimejAT787_0309150 [Lyophyllum shimeji]|uniref:Uncharacterized protein n=1 Tax=Lyophyllum shimeji TaxID=47721 RepID=A0A9P3UKQ6_LYOSH|nr:hypothetical protein LshimejAT787_0309150 [Lyophyllum shimeji]